MQQPGQSIIDLLTTAYDKCFDDCQAAISLEGQNNPAAADRYWKAVVGRVLDFRSAYSSADAFKTSAGKDAFKGLRELELTAQEHLDLHEGLRLSLQSLALQDAPSPGRSSASLSRRDSDNGNNGNSIVSNNALSESEQPPVLPPRPPLPPRAKSSSSGRAALVSSDRVSSSDSEQSQPYSSNPILPPPDPSEANTQADRSPSPEARVHKIRKTLRTGKSSFRSRDQGQTASGADRAAAAAWSAQDALPSFRRLSRDRRTNSPSSLSSAAHVLPSPPIHQDLQYDRNTRRMVPREAARGGDPPPYSSGELAAAAAMRNMANAARPETTSPGRSAMVIARREPISPRERDSARRMRNPARKAEAGGGRSAASLNRPASTATTEQPFGRPTENIPPDAVPSRNSERGTRPSSSATQKSPSLRETLHETPLVAEEGSDYMSAKAVDNGDDGQMSSPTPTDGAEATPEPNSWDAKRAWVLNNLPSWVEKQTATSILDEIDPNKDVIRWGDIAGLDEAKNALKEAVVYPFLRPDLFRGLREPPRGILLFGPPGTGKTMLARAVATESESTYLAITASTLNSKYLGESEKHVRALFTVAKMLAPSIIFVDEVDSVLSRRSSTGEHEASRRLKTEFLIQWSSLEKPSSSVFAGTGASAGAGAGALTGKPNALGDSRVLVLAATNRPWDLDDAATRRFARRQYIPLPEAETRSVQLRTLLKSEHQHCLTEEDIEELVRLTDGYSGSDITHLARQASYGPLRSHGEAVLKMSSDEIRPVELSDFVACLRTVRPSVNPGSLKQFDDWAKLFGERIS